MDAQTYLKQEKVKELAQRLGVQPNDTCYWDAHIKELKGSQRSKALKFNRLKLIEPKGKGSFLVHPIRAIEGEKDYNSTTYEVHKDGCQGWRCNCQWNVKMKMECSHIQAVHFYLATRWCN